jgi:hypothetical protein
MQRMVKNEQAEDMKLGSEGAELFIAYIIDQSHRAFKAFFVSCGCRLVASFHLQIFAQHHNQKKSSVTCRVSNLSAMVAEDCASR